MSSRTFLILIGAILVMIALIYTTPTGFDDLEPGLFLPDLKAGINEVDKISITGAGNEVIATLERGDSQWTVTERSGYPADVGKIRSNLIALADANIVEAKTADPALHDKLGVEDLDQPDATGKRIDIEGPGQSISLIVGETGVRGNMAYVRATDTQQSYLISADLDLGDQTADWLVKDIINISSSDIHSVTITHPDGGSLGIEKATREEAAFTVLDIPDGRELSYASIADPIGGVLTALTLDNVEAVADVDIDEANATVARFETFDGMVIVANAYEADDVTRVKFRVAADEALAMSFLDTGESSADTETPPDPPDFAAIATQAEELSEKLEPWIFTLPTFKSDQLIKNMEDLLK